MNNLAIIPARGGSKRIPGKNIKDFVGRPIISYSIETALNSGLFDEVMVSTDNEEIARVAETYGAKVPFLRSQENADDFAPAINVVKEVLCEYNNICNKRFEFVCCIFPTAPLISSEKLAKGLEVIKRGYESVYPVVQYSHPIWRGLKRDGDATSMIWKEYANARSQDLEQVFHDAGQWYWLNVNHLPNALLAENAASVVLSELEVQDIDNLLDWALAEMKYKLINKL